MINLNIKISEELSYSIKIPASVDSEEFQVVMKRMRAVFNVCKKINPVEEPVILHRVVEKKPANRIIVRRNKNPVMNLGPEERKKVLDVYSKVGTNGLAVFLEKQMGIERKANHWYHTVIYQLKKKAANNE